MNAYPWLYWCPHLTPERWEKECRQVEERFSLFEPFVEIPFLGFRGVVARGGQQYRVTVAADMDMYPTLRPSVYVTPSLPGARADGKVCIDDPWQPETSSFASVIATVMTRVEAAHGASSGAT